MKKLWVIIFGLLFSMALIAGCGQKEAPKEGGDSSAAPSQDKIYIGWVTPLTGVAADAGQQLQNGALLAIKQINAAGGINGRQLELVSQDDKSDPKEAANIATKFASDDKLVAVIGNYNSSCVLAGAPIYNEAKIPMIHTGTSPVITKEHGPYVFRISVPDAFQGTFVTDWLISDGYKNPAILYENDDYGRGLMEVASAEIGAKGGTVAASETYMVGDKDFTGILTKVKAAGADSIFIGGMYTEGALICKQMETVGLKVPVYASDALFEQAFVDLSGPAGEGIKVSGLFLDSDPSPNIQKFVNDYKTEYGKNPGTYATFHYDAMNVLAEAMKAVGVDRDKIRDYLTKMPPYTGVAGTITFDKENDAVRTELKKIVLKNGAWELVQ